MKFEPDYRHILSSAFNRKPDRLPLYEHIINAEFMEKYYDKKFTQLIGGSGKDIREFFRYFCGFFKEMTYDTVSFEVCICEVLPCGGAIMGGKPGPIQNRNDFDAYPWDEIPSMFWQIADKRFAALADTLPQGMLAVGGIGNGIFEISEDLVGYEYLCYMQNDDPELLNLIYNKVGDFLVRIWKEFLDRYGQYYCVCRFGDDLGFKTGLLTTKSMFHNHILPQYRRVISLIRNASKPFLWHSCGCIFDIMEDLIDIGINAKHSNEDQIAPFEKWIQLYSGKIGLFGGIDVNLLCQKSPSDVYEFVLEKGAVFRESANGFALGSGNSIPAYVPLDNFLAMVKAVQKLRV